MAVNARRLAPLEASHMNTQRPDDWQRLKAFVIRHWQSAMACLRRCWQRVRQVVAVLALVRFSLIIPVILAVALFYADQLTDMLQAVGEDGRLGDGAWLLAMSAFASLTVWYAARTMLRFRFASNPASDPAVHPCLKRWLPRALGTGVPGLLALRVATLAVLRSSESPGRLWLLAAALAGVAVAVAAYVIGRRSLARRTGLAWIALAEEVESRDLNRLAALPVNTRSVLWTLIGVNVAALILFMYPWASRMGAVAVLLLGLGLTAVIGSALVYAGNRYAVPVLTLLMGWTALWSYTNDNHRVRVTATSESHGAVSRAAGFAEASPIGQLTLEQYFAGWWQALERDSPAGNSAIPVVVVAAEGGGIRAAYWTASVLATLEDTSAGGRLPFSRQVFAISGVSGGSVGAAAFAAAVARNAEQGGAPPLSSVAQVQGMLGEDFLSPTLGVALFPDLLQRFVPWPMFDDRAMALEQAWERAWADSHPGERGRLRESFHHLWAGDAHRVPLLFLNSTVVESGQRALLSPLATVSTAQESAFADVLPLGRVMGTVLPLSAAAGVSARFTYVSPAGLVDTGRRGTDRWVRLVDGGYFDNSGAVTAQEIVRAMLRAHERLKASRGMSVVVLHLRNDPPNASAAARQTAAPSSGRAWLSEMLSPLRALLATRGARGAQAVEYLRREAGVQLLTVQPCRLHGDLPLGWVLSKTAQRDMQQQLQSCQDVGAHCAKEKLDDIDALLDGRSLGVVADSELRCALW
jgi:hypothetical protein